MAKDGLARMFGRRLQTLRREQGWSQPDLAQKIGTSGAVVGRYERGEITPSIEVARKLAEALGVTVDYLVSEHQLPEGLKDPAMLARWRALEELPPQDRERIFFLVDSLIRDAKARRTYAASA